MRQRLVPFDVREVMQNEDAPEHFCAKKVNVANGNVLGAFQRSFILYIFFWGVGVGGAIYKYVCISLGHFE